MTIFYLIKTKLKITGNDFGGLSSSRLYYPPKPLNYRIDFNKYNAN